MGNPFKPLNNMWVCIHSYKDSRNRNQQRIDWSTISGWKKGSIDSLIKDTGKPWSYWRDKYGWRCVKVNIHFEPVKK